MTARPLARLLTVMCLAIHGAGVAATALHTLDDLTAQSKAVFLVRVIEVRQPGWKDSAGASVALASCEVVRRLKGEPAAKVTMAYLVSVSDQEQLEAGKQYLVFAVSPSGSIYLGHQLRALPITGEDILVTGITGESSRQPLANFERRVRAVMNR